eukprot:1861926-Alexandrium_andersonii.AAC.1
MKPGPAQSSRGATLDSASRMRVRLGSGRRLAAARLGQPAQTARPARAWARRVVTPCATHCHARE